MTCRRHWMRQRGLIPLAGRFRRTYTARSWFKGLGPPDSGVLCRQLGPLSVVGGVCWSSRVTSRMPVDWPKPWRQRETGRCSYTVVFRQGNAQQCGNRHRIRRPRSWSAPEWRCSRPSIDWDWCGWKVRTMRPLRRSNRPGTMRGRWHGGGPSAIEPCWCWPRAIRRLRVGRRFSTGR